MLAAKQVPVLNLTDTTITSQAYLQTAFQSIHLCSTKEDKLSHGREESKKMRIQCDYLSDSDSLEDKTSQHLRTSPEERLYNTVKGSAQATQAALAKQPKIKKLPKEQASDKLTQMKEKDKSL